MDSQQVKFLISPLNFLTGLTFVLIFNFNSFWLMPAFMLKKIVLRNFAKGPLDSKMADAIDFMVDRVSGQNFRISYALKKDSININPTSI